MPRKIKKIEKINKSKKSKKKIVTASLCMLLGLSSFSSTYAEGGYSYLVPKKTLTYMRRNNKLTLADYEDRSKSYSWTIPQSTGFDFPVGNKNARGAYRSRHGRVYSGWYVYKGFLDPYYMSNDSDLIGERLHAGEDWNGRGGGDSDLGQAVHSVSEGVVVQAIRDAPEFGNSLLIAHILPDGDLVYSNYVHLDQIFVDKGIVGRREKIGTIGKGQGGRYAAHLHFEIRKDNMDGFPAAYRPDYGSRKDVEWVRDHYYSPTQFINRHRDLRDVNIARNNN